MIPTIKIKTKTTVITIIPAAAPATQPLDITRTTTTMEHHVMTDNIMSDSHLGENIN